MEVSVPYMSHDMSNLSSFKNIIIYILGKTWVNPNNWKTNNEYIRQFSKIKKLFGLQVEDKNFTFQAGKMEPVLDFYLLLENGQKINIVFSKFGVAISYLNRQGGDLKHFSQFKASNKEKKAEQIIKWIQNFLLDERRVKRKIGTISPQLRF